MYPIQEQRSGRGQGHGIETFVSRFDDLLRAHMHNGRARAFAFIFYDFHDHGMRRVMKDKDVFAELDRLSGKDLSVFYFDGRRESQLTEFNRIFMARLEVTDVAHPPCVVFFNLKEGRITDVSVAMLERGSVVTGFKEVYDILEAYIAGIETADLRPASVRWIAKAGNFVATELLRGAIGGAAGGVAAQVISS